MSAPVSALARVGAAFDAPAAADRPEVWIHRRSREDVEREATGAWGPEAGPLAGLLLAVKNNVDVAGFPTTAGCPAFATEPAGADAQAVARLRAAGAVVLGTTNLDQFATGLVGQRSPHGGVRDARRPERISGGSSSGSAVAVALGLVDVAIGTDTAGSGRVPAALQGIVGIKATLGVVSTDGVVPACRSWDAVTVFARDLGTADLAMGVMAGGPGTRAWPADAPLAAPPRARVAVPDALPALAPGYEAAFGEAVERLRAAGHEVVPVPFGPFLAAARLLYDGALVAERHAAVGAFVDARPEEVDPTVRGIITRAGTVTGSAMVRDLAELARLRVECEEAVAGCDALLVPTAPGHPTQAEVAADPVGVNAWMGTYTNFCNLFDLCAVAVPSGEVRAEVGGPATGPFGVTVLAPAFHDAVALDLAAQVQLPVAQVAAPGAAEPRTAAQPWPAVAGAGAVELFVVGAHLPGQPLVGQLTSRGAHWLGAASTEAAYRLVALDTVPPKPGLVRVGPEEGATVLGGVWQLSAAALGAFLAELPAPMGLTRVVLDDGREVVGFTCTHDAARGARDITGYGGWLAYLGRDGRPGA